MMGNPKHRKLDELERFRRRVPHASASALNALLREAKRSGVPELHSRGVIQEARNAKIGEDTEYGPIRV